MEAAENILWERLSPGEKTLYKRYEQAFSVFASTVNGSGLERDVDELKVMQAVLGDHPEVVYFDRTQLRLAQPVFRKKTIRLEGAMSPARSEACARTLRATVKNAVEEIRQLNPMSDYDKLICIYEYIQDHVVYDRQELEDNLRFSISRTPSRHSAYGALVEGRAVCDGFASAFALLAQSFGYRCATVTGEAVSSTGECFLHAWNIVMAGGAYYHMDVTWDSQKKCRGEDYSYEYFCLNDSEMGLDHIWEISATPACNGRRMSFYVRNCCYANSLSQLDDIFLRYVKSEAAAVRVKLSGGVAVPEPADHTIAQRLLAAATSVGRSIQIEYRWNRVLQCFYAKVL